MHEYFWKKNRVWIFTELPAAVMVIMLVVHPAFWKLLTPYTGYAAVGFLIGVLSLNPLKSIFPSVVLLKRLNLYRQEFGVACFIYALIHILCFAIKRGSLSAMIPYMLHPALIPVVFIAIPIFVVLTVTSTKASQKKMGFLKWKRLHRKVYFAEAAVVLHMVLVGEKFWAIVLFTPLLIIQCVRVYRNNKLKNKTISGVKSS